MMHTSRRTIRVLMLSGLLIGAGLVPNVFAQGTSSADDSAFFREFPLALVYRGVALYAAKDYDGAITAWQGYIDRAGKDADTAGVGELIREAWIQEYPLSLVYDSYARHQAGDIVGAIAALERYIELAPVGEDTTAIRQMIVKNLVPEVEMAKISDRGQRAPVTKPR